MLGPAKPFIEAVLEADREAPRKQQHTAHRIWERIRAELGIEVAESTVRKYVGCRKRELFGPTEVMVPQVKDPGAEAEADFFQAAVILAGTQVVVWFFQMRACYSGRVQPHTRCPAERTQRCYARRLGYPQRRRVGPAHPAS